MFKNLFYKFRWLLVLAAVLSSVSAVAGIAMLSMITEVINGIEGGSKIPSYSFAIFILTVFFVLVAGICSQFILIKLSSTVVYEVQKNLLQRILASEYATIERIGGNRIIATLETDVEALAHGLLTIPNFAFNAVTLLLCITYMVYVSPFLFLFVLVIMVALVGLVVLLLSYARRHQEALREYIDEFYGNMRSLTNGGKEFSVNNYRKIHFYNAEMLPLFNKIRQRTLKAGISFMSLDVFTTTLFYLLVGCVVYGANFVAGETETSVVVTFVLVILYLLTPLTQLVGMGKEISAVPVSLKKIEMLKLSDAEKFSMVNENGRDFAPKNWAKIVLSSVQYQYKNNSDSGDSFFSVGPICAEIESGKVTFITGGNGSGKSTFAKLLVGLYKADSGAIYLDSALLGGDVKLEDYMNEVSVIFSDFFVFDQVLDRQGNPADDGTVAEYLKSLKLDGKITSSSGKLSSTELSSGQRKRLALLQACIEDAKVCVFDELAADQDSDFKYYFYNEFLPRLKSEGKFVIVISHDENFYGTADKILHFENGNLAQERYSIGSLKINDGVLV